jgi:capsule polysaccharide modification protein KpsS
MRVPKNQPRLLALRSFTATYNQVHSKKEANQLDKWIRRAIAGSSKLEELCMICDQQEPDHSDFRVGPAVAHDPIVDHIAKKHADTIRILRFHSAFVSINGLKALFGTCTKLEICQFRARKEVLVSTGPITTSL